MGLFGKPSLAQIYIKELRSGDGTLVPLFAPDVDITLGTIGTFDRGQLLLRGSPKIGIELREPGGHDANGLDLHAALRLPRGRPRIGGGGPCPKGKLSFKRDRAVIASFKGVTESAAVWPAGAAIDACWSSTWPSGFLAMRSSCERFDEPHPAPSSSRVREASASRSPPTHSSSAVC